MAKLTIEDTTLTNIADAIRAKGNTTDSLTPVQMPAAIAAIVAGGGASGGGYNTTDYTVVSLSDAARVSVAAADAFDGVKGYAIFTDWTNYFTSAEDVEILIVKISNNAYFYVKGLCPIYSNGGLGMYRALTGSYSSQTITEPTETWDASNTYSAIFTKNGMEFNPIDLGSKNAVFLIAKKGA